MVAAAVGVVLVVDAPLAPGVAVGVGNSVAVLKFCAFGAFRPNPSPFLTFPRMAPSGIAFWPIALLFS